MANKRHRQGKWRYTIRRAGVLPKPIYLSFEDEAEGDEYVNRLEALLERGIVPDDFMLKKKPATSLRAAIRAYRASQSISETDERMLTIVAYRLPMELSLVDLTFKWATDWATSLKREQNLAPSTIRHHVGALARCLDWLAASGDILVNPLRLLPKGYTRYSRADAAAVAKIEGHVKTDTERDRRLEPAEEIRIREILAGKKPEGRQRPLALNHGDALRLLFDVALESAMRMREMFTLRVSQIDMKQQTIFLEKTKNGSKRQVPMTTVLQNLLVPHLKGMQPDDLVFPWWDGSTDKKSLQRTTSLLSRQFARIASAAGCEDLHFHDLRHEATSRLYERTDLSDLQIAKITGHKTLAMLARYANLRGSSLAGRLW